MNGFASAVNHTTTDQLAGDQVERDEWRHRRRWWSRAVWIGRCASRPLSAMASRRSVQRPGSKCGRELAPDCGGSEPHKLTDTLLSGASPLPHFSFVVCFE